MKTLSKALMLAALSVSLFACSSSTTTTTENTTDQTEMTETTDTATEESTAMDTADEDSVAKMIVGIWTSDVDSNSSIQFNEDGSVSDNLYFGEDRVVGYKVEADDSIVLSEIDTDYDNDVDLDDIFDTDLSEVIYRTTDRNQALAEDDYYFLDGNTLIFNEMSYTRTNS